jgi:nucleotide-binding universal stress UspA family protein
MAYRTILVHVDESGRAMERVRIAADIARIHDAHLIGVAATGVPESFYPVGVADPAASAAPIDLEFFRERANRALAQFDAEVQRLGVASFERQLVDDEAGSGISLHARHCDLTVIGQTDPNEASPVVPADFPEYVVMHSGRPVLIIPYAGQFGAIGKRVLVAWDASTAAARAVADAIPLLKQADAVDVVTFNPEQQAGVGIETPSADIASYLARHSIKAVVTRQKINIPAGEALLSLTSDFAADLLVMGGYGHSRFSEIWLGGVTRAILESMTVPVFMSH